MTCDSPKKHGGRKTPLSIGFTHMNADQGIEMDADEFFNLGLGVRYARKCGCRLCRMFIELHGAEHGQQLLMTAERFIATPLVVFRAFVEGWTQLRITEELEQHKAKERS